MRENRVHTQSSLTSTASAEKDAVKLIFLITFKKPQKLQNTSHTSLSLLGNR